MPITRDTTVQVLLPVYNEAGSIEDTLRELDKTLSPLARVELVVCEDGSTDGTREILKRLAGELPMKLVLGTERLGYSRAVIEGWRACTAPYVLSLDSDGQCDPRDFEAFMPRARPDAVIMGWRRTRQDSFARRAMSGLFKVIYRGLTGVRLRDPSCPFLLVPRGGVEYLLRIPTLGLCWLGFWWEVAARFHRAGMPFVEVPVNHRPRAAGRTQVYRVRKLAGIFFGHLVAVARIVREPVPPLTLPPAR
jgi:dolichol-phosphate mannosyltransferase